MEDLREAQECLLQVEVPLFWVTGCLATSLQRGSQSYARLWTLCDVEQEIVMPTNCNFFKCRALTINIIQCEQPPQIPHCSCSTAVLLPVVAIELTVGMSPLALKPSKVSWLYTANQRNKDKRSCIYTSLGCPWPHTAHSLSFSLCYQMFPDPWLIQESSRL